MRRTGPQGHPIPGPLLHRHETHRCDVSHAEQLPIARALHLGVLARVDRCDLGTDPLEDVTVGGARRGADQFLAQEVGQRAVGERAAVLADLILVRTLLVPAPGDEHVALAQGQPAAGP